MLPDNTITYDDTLDVLNDFTLESQPSYTFALRFETDNRIKGYVDDIEAIKQAIYLILNTERYEYLIYSRAYGIELLDLFGKDSRYVVAVLPTRIKEALTQDDRINDVTDFEFEVNKNKVFVKFTAVTEYAEIQSELEVNI